jgi:hypothetical protein
MNDQILVKTFGMIAKEFTNASLKTPTGGKISIVLEHNFSETADPEWYEVELTVNGICDITAELQAQDDDDLDADGDFEQQPEGSSISDYAHWNEEAPIIWAAENRR